MTRCRMHFQPRGREALLPPAAVSLAGQRVFSSIEQQRFRPHLSDRKAKGGFVFWDRRRQNHQPGDRVRMCGREFHSGVAL